MRPSGSTLCSTWPSNRPGSLWKYQYGMPFCIGTITVSGPHSSGTLSATAPS